MAASAEPRTLHTVREALVAIRGDVSTPQRMAMAKFHLRDMVLCFMQEHCGLPFCLQCRQCGRIAYPVLPKHQCKHPRDTFLRYTAAATGSAGSAVSEFNLVDMMLTPMRLTMDLSGPGGGRGDEMCPHCNVALTLINPIIDVLDTAGDVRRCARSINAAVGLPEPRPGEVSVTIDRRSWRSTCVCAHCSQPNPHHKCAGCQAIRYCSTQCQTLHWPRHMHVCKFIRTHIERIAGMVDVESTDV